jgi:hypothetical protein
MIWDRPERRFRWIALYTNDQFRKSFLLKSVYGMLPLISSKSTPMGSCRGSIMQVVREKGNDGIYPIWMSCSAHTGKIQMEALLYAQGTGRYGR